MMHGLLRNIFSSFSRAKTPEYLGRKLLRECDRRKSNPSKVKSLILAGARLDFQASNKDTALHRAVDRGRLEIVKELLLAGADTEMRDALGFTPLMRAAGRGKTDIACALVEAGADVNSETGGVSVVRWAMVNGSPMTGVAILNAFTKKVAAEAEGVFADVRAKKSWMDAGMPVARPKNVKPLKIVPRKRF